MKQKNGGKRLTGKPPIRLRFRHIFYPGGIGAGTVNTMYVAQFLPGNWPVVAGAYPAAQADSYLNMGFPRASTPVCL